jgi:hypothetical protein
MPSWATPHIERLAAGLTVSFRPRGHSMEPLIKSGQLCTVAPIPDKWLLQTDQVVLCRVRGTDYLHKLGQIIRHPAGLEFATFEIKNNKGRVNGWIRHDAIFGKLIKVED